MQTDGPQALVDRLEAVASCFAEDYENETPAHPARGFRGRAQVRRNWEQIFASVPDLHAKVVRSSVDNEHVWTEWDMAGTRLDGTAHRMRGVIVFEVQGAVASRARFYVEPVDEGPGSVDDAVRDQVVRP